MKRHNLIRILLYTLFAISSLTASAADDAWTQDGIFESADVRDSIAMADKKHHRLIWFDQEDLRSFDGQVEEIQGGRLEYHYLTNRRALTGETCAINKMINSVGVGSWNGNLGNVLNDDLNDYCEFNAVASVGVTTDPIISIRDASCYYAKGTTAGFCLSAGSGDTALSLDLVSAMAIGFYRDGNLVKVVAVDDGQSAGVLGLSLIHVPGSPEANINIEVKAPGVFDEITLDFAGGVSVSAGMNLRIKYAYVGKAKDFSVTYYDYHDNQYGILPDPDKGFHIPDEVQEKYKITKPLFHELDEANEDVVLDYVKGWNPVLLGLPFPVVEAEREKFINKPAQDINGDDFMTLTPIAAVGYQGGAKFMLKHSKDETKEVFEAGAEVGFIYKYLSVLNLGLGTWIDIVLFDRNGNKVQQETLTADGLTLSLAQGGAQTTTFISKVPFSGAEIRFMTGVSVDVGGIALYRAFVREEPETRHHCEINPSASTNICKNQTTLQLRSNPAVSVSWSIVEKPEKSPVTVTDGGFVSGLEEPDGKKGMEYRYIFRATAADGCYDEVIITHLPDDDPEHFNNQCGIPLVNPKKPDGATEEPAKEYEVITEEDWPGLTGGLLHFDDLQNPENVLTTDLNDFATYTGGLELGTNTPVIGIHKLEGNIVDYSIEGETKKRLGFMVASSVEGLNLSALQLWQVGCYWQGHEVCRKVIDESNVVSTDIGGSNRGQKMRYSIAVPDEMTIDGESVPTQVDMIILWSSGVIAIEAGSIDIYYPFIEEADAGCNDPMGCKAQLLSTEDCHATLDFDLMQSGSAIVVANAVNDLGNFIDDDMESYMSVANSVSAGAGIPIAVKVGRTVDYRHQLGIVMDNKTYLAGVNAGTWLTIETYYRGEPTGDKFDDWNVIDANVIGYGDRNVLIVQPKYLYDEVKMTIGKVVGALDIMKFYGMFLRGDIDNDGVPDCQDPTSCSVDMHLIDVSEVCVGDEITFMADGDDGRSYWVLFSEPLIKENGEKEQRLSQVQADEQGLVKQSYVTQTPGMYQVVFYEDATASREKVGEDGKIMKDENGHAVMEQYHTPGKPMLAETYYVHPEETRWLVTATNSDWTKWDNWSDGTPYCCTRVIIPSDAVNYPNLDGEVTVKNPDEYCCSDIHFEPRAEIGSVNKLNYESAWVEMDLMPNRYNLLSAPLQRMYTGDMFVADATKVAELPVYFTPLTATDYPANRFNPTIYQRMWSTSVKEQGWNALAAVEMGTDGDKLVEIEGLSTAQWSRNFNHVATEYGNGQGFSVWVDNGNLPEDQSLRFRFPKAHTEYTYFSDYDGAELTDVKEKVERLEKAKDDDSKEVIGRFIYEPEVKEGGLIPFRVTKKATVEGEEDTVIYDRKVYTGAPDMTVTLTSARPSGYFLFGNPFMSPIDARELLRANTSLKGLMYDDGTTVKTLTYDRENEVFAETSDFGYIQPMTSVFLVVDDAAKATSLDIALNESMISRKNGESVAEDAGEAPAPESLRMTLKAGEGSASVLILSGEEGMPNEALLDSEVAPGLALLAVADGRAYDIAPGGDEVPLAVVKPVGETVRLEFSSYGGFNREEWRLRDMARGTSFELDREIELPADEGNSAGRYRLVKAGLVTPVEENVNEEVYIEFKDDKIIVKSLGAEITEIQLFGLDGSQLSNQSLLRGMELSVKAPTGIFLLIVRTESGSLRTFKLARR